MNENELKQNIAHNITALRKKNNMTQADLAEKLSYSDKSISKWERGDGYPDILVLTRIAEMFGVTVNDLVSENSEKVIEEIPRDTTKHRRVLLTALAAGLVWFFAALTFVVLKVIMPDADWLWLSFICAIPASMIVVVVFAHLWWGNIFRCLSVSLLVWGTTVSVHLTSLVPNVQNMKLIYIAAGVFQVLVVLWYLYQYVRKNKHSDAHPEENADDGAEEADK